MNKSELSRKCCHEHKNDECFFLLKSQTQKIKIYSLVILKPCDPGDEFLPVGSTREVVLCLPLIVPLYMTLVKTGRFAVKSEE